VAKRYTRSNNTDRFTSVIDYLLAYSKTDQFQECLFPREDEADERYDNPDDDDRGPWKAIPFTNPRSAKDRPQLSYPITNPNTGETTVPTGEQKAWRRSEEEFEKLVEEDKIWWGQDGESKIPDMKLFLSEVRDGMTQSISGITNLLATLMPQLQNLNPYLNIAPLTLLSQLS